MRTFNAAIPGIVQSKVNAGKHVHLVDMHSALTTADLIDGIHPTAGGYDKMAARWYSALQSVPGSIGDPGRQRWRADHRDRGRAVRPLRRRPRPAAPPTAPRCSCGTVTGGTNQQWTYTTARQLTVYGNKCLDAAGDGTANGTLRDHLRLQRRNQPAVERQRQRHHHRRAVRPLPGRLQRGHRPTARSSSSGPAPARPTSSGVADSSCGRAGWPDRISVHPAPPTLRAVGTGYRCGCRRSGCPRGDEPRRGSRPARPAGVARWCHSPSRSRPVLPVRR